MPKYTFTKKNAAGEEFRAEGCDSFDEAIRRVERGIADREASLAETAKEVLSAIFPQTAPAAKQEVPPAKPDMIEKYDADGNVIK